MAGMLWRGASCEARLSLDGRAMRNAAREKGSRVKCRDGGRRRSWLPRGKNGELFRSGSSRMWTLAGSVDHVGEEPLHSSLGPALSSVIIFSRPGHEWSAVTTLRGGATATLRRDSLPSPPHLRAPPPS
ncbi:hypothetical protein BDZ90DRAFT_1955 [Jaminaea rosea]|uniref:Uncharacterized protein n=1 Tax=Jaminaea rosea TaxID=1569628 RepID=A0A316V3F5_9BASI|nr:hypothetical protein BDZ90DRAFT_1955 [Jaminaea rosea]PWN29975.1 hypothetical protein BDZ90DRAFT_1955 [Jaminaea rosea]